MGTTKQRLRNWTAKAVVASLLVGTGITTTSMGTAGACAGSSAIASAETTSEQQFTSKLNSLRRSRGLSQLAFNHAIGDRAEDWSETMAGQGWLHHAVDVSTSDGVLSSEDYRTLVKQAVPDAVAMAENVGQGSVRWCTTSELNSAAASAVGRLHNAFVASSGHYANMVGNYNQVGIGVHIDSRNMWVTVRFARGSLPVSATSATARYIDAVHRLFVNRGARSTDISRWAGHVQAGNRGALTAALAVSDEWAGVRVNDLYRKVLGRSADRSGRAFWVSQIASGLRLEDVAAEMYGSREYYIRNGSTHRRYIAALYRDILGRNADDGGLRYWSGLLGRGMSRPEAAASFYASIESRNDRVHTLYREILGRSPDSGGAAYWANTLLRTGDVALASFLASSDEFYRKNS